MGFARFVAIYLWEYRSGMVFTTSIALAPLCFVLLSWLVAGRLDTDLSQFAMVFSPALLLVLVLLWGMAIPGLRRRISATRELLRTLSVADVLLVFTLPAQLRGLTRVNPKLATICCSAAQPKPCWSLARTPPVSGASWG